MSSKLKRKAKPYKAPINLSNYTVNQISSETGAKVESLKFWCREREKEYEKIYAEEARNKLWMAEDYIAVANVLISIVANRMTWGFTKANQKFLENLNPAKEYLERNGVKKTYEELHKQMGIELVFDSIDIDKEFGFDSEDLDDYRYMSREALCCKLEDIQFLLMEKTKECEELRKEIRKYKK